MGSESLACTKGASFYWRLREGNHRWLRGRASVLELCWGVLVVARGRQKSAAWWERKHQIPGWRLPLRSERLKRPRRVFSVDRVYEGRDERWEA